MSKASGKGWVGEIEGQGPVQGWGRVDGHAWFFRARHNAWSLEIAEDSSVEPDQLPVVTYGYSGWIIREEWGSTKSAASYMAEETAWSLIERCFKAFRQGQLPYIPK